jgi:hypothetical protein
MTLELLQGGRDRPEKPWNPDDRQHPIEVARRALREAALIERDSFWSERLRRFADALPSRGRG